MSIYTYKTAMALSEILEVPFDQSTAVSDQELDIIPSHEEFIQTPDKKTQSRLSKLSRESFRKRLAEKGPTEKELAYRKVCSEKFKTSPLHNKPHSDLSKKIISEKKKLLLSNKTKHPMWGKTTYKVTSPEGEGFIVSAGWKQWCIDRGLSNSNLSRRGKSKGWKAEMI